MDKKDKITEDSDYYGYTDTNYYPEIDNNFTPQPWNSPTPEIALRKKHKGKSKAHRKPIKKCKCKNG